MLRLRLTRLGRKKRPYYRIVAVDSHKRRDSDYLDRIGYYHPLDNPATVELDADKALKYLRTGAQPSDTVLSLLKREGVWLRFRLEKRGLPEEKIHEMMADWMATHANKPQPVAKAEPMRHVAVEEAAEAEAVEAAPAESAQPVAEEPEATPETPEEPVV